MPPLDYSMMFAATNANPFNLYDWPQFGPMPLDGFVGERPMRICPVCFATVPNEAMLMRRHVGWHQARGELHPDGVVNG